MRRLILALVIVALALSGCFNESDKWCTTWKFSIDDSYAPGDFDSKIGNDVLFTVFQHGKVVSSYVIPRGDIVNGEYYTQSVADTDGSTVVTAWGVPPSDTTECYTPLPVGTDLQSLYFDVNITAPTGGASVPFSPLLYAGADTVADNNNYREIKMRVTYCRVEVRVHNAGEGIFELPTADPEVIVKGVTSKVNLLGQGVGADYSKLSELTPTRSPDNTVSSGIIPVMPSRPDQSISVDVMDGSTKIATLSGTPENPIIATAGGYILFDYYPFNHTLVLSVDGWTIKGEVVVM